MKFKINKARKFLANDTKTKKPKAYETLLLARIKNGPVPLSLYQNYEGNKVI